MRDAVRQVTQTVAARAVYLVLGAVSGVVIARRLQPEGRGAYVVITTITAITISVGHLSIEQSHVWLWSRRVDRRSIAANSLVLGALVGGLAALVTAVTVVALGPRVIPVAGYGELALALAVTPAATSVLYLNNVLVLRGRVRDVNRGAMLGGAVQCAALILLAMVTHLSPARVIALWALSVCLPLVVLLPAARPRLRHRDLSLARLALGRGMRYHIGLASLFLLFRADILILDALTTTAAVGLYSLAVNLAELTRVVTDAVAQVALPGQTDTDDDGAAAAVTLRITRVTALCALCSVGLMCAAAPAVVPMVYGQAFAGSVPALLALAPGLLALGATRPIGAFLLRLDRPFLASALSVAALSINIALNLALVPVCGIVGSALASSVAYGALAAAQGAWFLRATGLPARSLLPGRAEREYVRVALARIAPSRRVS